MLMTSMLIIRNPILIPWQPWHHPYQALGHHLWTPSRTPLSTPPSSLKNSIHWIQLYGCNEYVHLSCFHQLRLGTLQISSGDTAHWFYLSLASGFGPSRTPGHWTTRDSVSVEGHTNSLEMVAGDAVSKERHDSMSNPCRLQVTSQV